MSIIRAIDSVFPRSGFFDDDYSFSPVTYWPTTRQTWPTPLTREVSAAPIVGPDGFQVNLDVQQFKPEEITVKNVENSVVVEGKHEERPDEHGFVTRHFVRRYSLPKEFDPQQVKVQLSADGILTIGAPKKALPGTKERVIPITHTNVPAVKPGTAAPAPVAEPKKK